MFCFVFGSNFENSEKGENPCYSNLPCFKSPLPMPWLECAVAMDVALLLTPGRVAEYVGELAKLLATSSSIIFIYKGRSRPSFFSFFFRSPPSSFCSAAAHHRRRAVSSQLKHSTASASALCAFRARSPLSFPPKSVARRRLPRNRSKRRRAHTSPSSAFHRKPPHQPFAVLSSSCPPDAHTVDAFTVYAQVRRVRRLATVSAPP